MSEEWDGLDRRQADPWRHDMEQRMDRMEGAIGCIKRRGDDFEQTYGGLLRETLEARAMRAKLWATACDELVKKGILAAVIALCAALAIGAKEYLRRWFLS